MTRKLILIAGMALVLASCGDNDDVATSEPSMVDKVMDATRDVAGSVTDAVKDTTSEVIEGGGDMASDAVDATRNVVHDTAQGIADATNDKTEDFATDEEALEYMDKEMEKLR